VLLNLVLVPLTWNKSQSNRQLIDGRARDFQADQQSKVRCAVLCPEWRAAAIVFVDNHPSGDPAPSQEDQEITPRLKEIGDLFGIKVLDHVIVGHERFFSFADKGLL
jgi:DNA repair protein RadC